MRIIKSLLSCRIMATLLPVFALLVLALAGCGGEAWHAATYPAGGVVSVNGTPPEGLVVELHSTGEKVDQRQSRPWGITDSSGHYELTTYEKNDGAPAGEYAVVLRWPPDINRPSFADRLEGAYSSVKKSPFRVTVAAEENEVPEIKVEGVRLKSASSFSRSSKKMPGPKMGK